MASIVNKDLKKTVWDSVNRGNVTPLLVRVTTGNMAITINFTSVKFFTLTTTAIVIQTAPVVATLLAVFILKEKLLCSTLVILFVAFAGVILMILGAAPQPSDVLPPPAYALPLLLLNPVLIATGEVAMLAMGKMPETLVSLYMNFTMLFTSFFLIKLTGGTFDECAHWKTLDWVLMVALSCTVLMS